tara:strand:+ start:63864 stop:65909 length:2046 start_codon:yes stop_codon:yes gene_type:complete
MMKNSSFNYQFGYYILKPFLNRKNSLFYIILLISFGAFAQGPGSLFVDAGPDINIDCGASGGCTDITASFLETFETASAEYTVASIPYNPPFPFNGLSNSINISTDDTWSPVDTLPYDFCFFGDVETEFQVGSNGVIRFDVDPGDTTNGWSFSEDLPNNSNPTLGEANVFTPVHDIHPSINPGNEIGYEVLGTFPNRVLVVSYFDVAMFSSTCNSLLATHMAVFYEFSNVIEIYIQDKPSCPTWNSGNAAVGIQNDAGDVAYVPPGRNTSDSPWTTTNEAWRFTPDGVETYVFEWLDSSGTVIGTTPTINVCPANGSEVFTARVTYTNTCNGDVVVLTDDVLVTASASFVVDLGGDQIFCDQESYDITAQVTGGSGTPTFLWNTGETTQTITVTESGTYSVDVDIDGCVLTESVEIILEDSPIIELGDDIETCFEEPIVLDATPSNFNAGDATYVWSLDGVVIASATGPLLNVTEGGLYSVVVTVSNCFSEDSINISPRTDLEVALGDDFKSCPDDGQVITATTSETDITYQWLLNGDVISGETGDSIMVELPANSVGTQTYTVIITKGECTGTDSIDVSLYNVGNCVISQGISPNGDGLNDCLDLEFLVDRQGSFSLEVFNRYGTSVYSESDYLNQWCGQTNNGDALPTGTYFYVMKFETPDPEFGSVKNGWIYINKESN